MLDAVFDVTTMTIHILQQEGRNALRKVFVSILISTKELYPKPYTLRPAPCTLYPSPFTLHPTPYTLHPTPCTVHPTCYTLSPQREAGQSAASIDSFLPCRVFQEAPLCERVTTCTRASLLLFYYSRI